MTGFRKGWRDRAALAQAKRDAQNDPEAVAERAAIRAQREAMLAKEEKRLEAERRHQAKTIRQPVLAVAEVLGRLPPDDLETLCDATRYSFSWIDLAQQIARFRVDLDRRRAKALEELKLA